MPIEETEKRKPFVPEKVEEVGRIVRRGTSDIVVRVSLYRGKIGVDIRYWLKIPEKNFEGWSKRGVYFEIDSLDEFLEILKKVHEKYGKSDGREVG